MKKILFLLCSLFLLAVISYSTCYKSWIRLSYEVNKLEIIEEFCINKDKTEFQCDGKCHLKTQLDKAEDQNSPKKAKITEENVLTLFYVAFNKVKINQHLETAINIPFQDHTYKFLHHSFIFHPPESLFL